LNHKQKFTISFRKIFYILITIIISEVFYGGIITSLCSNCGKPIDDNAKICQNCGEALSTKSTGSVAPPSGGTAPSSGAMPSGSTSQKETSFDRQEIMSRAVPFFAARSYAVQTQTDYLISFQSQDRDVNWVIVLVFCCLGIIPAVIYYFWFTHQHQVTVSLSGATSVKVTAMGNTEKAIKDAAEFMQSI
jgi:hypothetical protein